MRPAAIGRFARSVLSATARGAGEKADDERVGQAVAAAVDALTRAAGFFQTEDGRLAADFLQSSRVPAPERKALAEELARALGLPGEVVSLVEVLAGARALRILHQVAERASSLAGVFTRFARVEIRTALALPEGTVPRIRAAMERILGRPTRLEIVEDEELIAGVVVRSGDRIWDGSLRGRMARAREALAAGGMLAGT